MEFSKELASMKLWDTTRHQLKILAAQRGISMISLLDDLVNQAIESKDPQQEEKKLCPTP
jgi:hypothetical protein